jgi:hypothetical protein
MTGPNTWGDAAEPPYALPAGVAALAAKPVIGGTLPTGNGEEEKLPNWARGGVSEPHLAKPGIEVHWAGDRPLIGSPGDDKEKPRLPNLSNVPFLTIVIGDQRERDRAKSEAKGSPLEKAFQLNVYDPTDWHVSAHKLDVDSRFKSSGRVAILQEPSGSDKPGKAMFAVYSWTSLADLQNQLAGFGSRTPKPNYEPDRTPGPMLSTPAKGLILLCLIGFGLYALNMKSEEQLA